MLRAPPSVKETATTARAIAFLLHCPRLSRESGKPPTPGHCEERSDVFPAKAGTHAPPFHCEERSDMAIPSRSPVLPGPSRNDTSAIYNVIALPPPPIIANAGSPQHHTPEAPAVGALHSSAD